MKALLLTLNENSIAGLSTKIRLRRAQIKFKITKPIFTTLHKNLASVRLQKYKLVVNFKERKTEIYNLAQDPGEQTDLSSRNEEAVNSEMNRGLVLLRDWLNQQLTLRQQLPRSGLEELQLTDTLEEELRSLGYLQN